MPVEFVTAITPAGKERQFPLSTWERMPEDKYGMVLKESVGQVVYKEGLKGFIPDEVKDFMNKKSEEPKVEEVATESSNPIEQVIQNLQGSGMIADTSSPEEPVEAPVQEAPKVTKAAPKKAGKPAKKTTKKK